MTESDDRLEATVGQIAETVLAATDAIEQLADRLDELSSQVQQQGYEIFALSDAMQTLAANQADTLIRLSELTETLQQMNASLKEADDSPSEELRSNRA
ncbi:hypothetical protein C7B65_15675 [Phormidesmis priestleyi ULC007]|uniref:Uncharacterized protein n=1 Tax=Phormidesmis priestleyi ULC007 TaxID=1920490 RepID=A0A2T1DCZ1_9CYAN|nr:hypothetical protein [Phormidesmis priestleyi]PSB18336.1 hypothetical protein C7B65_15675 [Phormidesmis priestleyi ULC007]PZO46584.1 MAG: hypothetical protein DCF14_22385 [Phormidesmis priestleyi]